MTAEPDSARTRAHAIAAHHDPEAGSAAPLLVGIVGYLAFLPVVAFGLCAAALIF